MPTFKGDQEQIAAQLRAAGLIRGEGTPVRLPDPPGAKAARGKKAELVKPGFCRIVSKAHACCSWRVPLKLDSTANSKAFVKAHVGVAGRHRRVVAAALAGKIRHLVPYTEAAVAGRPVRCLIERVGGGVMDDDNLGIVCKWVRDTVALFLGVGDGPRGPVAWSYGQSPGGPYGVRITLSENPL